MKKLIYGIMTVAVSISLTHFCLKYLGISFWGVRSELYSSTDNNIWIASITSGILIGFIIGVLAASFLENSFFRGIKINWWLIIISLISTISVSIYFMLFVVSQL